MKYSSSLHVVPHFETSPSDVLHVEGGEGVDERVAALMGALTSPTRIRVLFVLPEAVELFMGELAKLVKMSDSSTSYQLRVLRDFGLIRRRREGQRAFYSLADWSSISR